MNNYHAYDSEYYAIVTQRYKIYHTHETFVKI